MCSTWQESVPAIGLTFSDQRQPGSKVPPADRVAAQIDHFDAAFVVGELAYLIGTLESLLRKRCHLDPPRLVGSVRSPQARVTYAGLMFWFRWKKLVGSYLALRFSRRVNVSVS